MSYLNYFNGFSKKTNTNDNKNVFSYNFKSNSQLFKKKGNRKIGYTSCKQWRLMYRPPN